MTHVYQTRDITDPYDISYLGIFSTIELCVNFLTNSKKLKALGWLDKGSLLDIHKIHVDKNRYEFIGRVEWDGEEDWDGGGERKIHVKEIEIHGKTYTLKEWRALKNKETK